MGRATSFQRIYVSEEGCDLDDPTETENRNSGDETGSSRVAGRRARRAEELLLNGDRLASEMRLMTKRKHVVLLVLWAIRGQLVAGAEPKLTPILAGWEVVAGDASTWSLDGDELQCRNPSGDRQWIVSRQKVKGHWVLEAELSDRGASQGILFTVGEHLAYGYLLFLKDGALTLSRVMRPAESSISEEFDTDLSQWRITDGRPSMQVGKAVFVDSASSGGNAGLLTRNYVTLNQNVDARVEVRNFTGTGGYQVEMQMTDGRNSVQIQRRGGDFGSNVRLTVSDGSKSWSSQPVSVSGEDFDLRVSYDRSTGIFTGFYDATDGKGWRRIGDSSRSSVTFATWSQEGIPTRDRGTVRLPPQTPVKGRLHCFGSTSYRMELDNFFLGPARASHSPHAEAVRIEYTPAIHSWKVQGPSRNTRQVKVTKYGGSYTFYVDGGVVATVTNPRVRTMDDLGGLLKNPEPDSGSYGFAFEGKGSHSVSNIRFRNVQLAEKYKGNPVLPSRGPRGAWDDQMIHNACVRRFGDAFYIYYTGRTQRAGKHAHSEGGRLGVAVSRDGYHFTRFEKNPVFDRVDPETGERAGNVQGGAVTRLPDGRFAITYTVHDGKRWHRLESAVGVTPVGPFKARSDHPLLETGGRDEFDGEHVHLHDVQALQNGTYALLYTGFSIGRSQRRMGDKGGLATSRDFETWKKHAGNPVFPLGEPGTWDDGHVRPKGFVKYGEYYFMFYEGAHKSDYLPYFFDQVGMARSKDLVHWERFPHNPVIPIDAGGGRDTIVTEWPSPAVTKDGLAIFYWGGSPGQVAISRADIPRNVLERWGE